MVELDSSTAAFFRLRTDYSSSSWGVQIKSLAVLVVFKMKKINFIIRRTNDVALKVAIIICRKIGQFSAILDFLQQHGVPI